MGTGNPSQNRGAAVTRVQSRGDTRVLEVTAVVPKGDCLLTSLGISAFLKNAWAKEPVLVVSFSVWGLGECPLPPGSHQHSTAQFHLASPCQPYPDITVALPSPHTRGAHSTQFDSVGRTPRRSLTYANLSASLPPRSGTGLLTVLMH